MIVLLLTIHLLAFAIWVGSLVALPIAVRQLKSVAGIDIQARFFPRLGRTYAKVGTAALAVAIVSGGMLAGAPTEWSNSTLAAIVVALVVLGVTAISMVQARKVGKLRSALAHGESSGARAEAHLAAQVRLTDVGRGLIVLGTLIAVVLEAATIANH